MPDQRELYEDPEEAFRAAWAGIRTHMMTALPGIIDTDSPDGHTARLVLAIKRAVEDQNFNTTTYQEFPVLPDVPIHHPGGGGMTHTFAVKALDEVLTIFASRAIDAWHQSGGTQQPIFNRLHSLSDAMVIPGMRSDPRKLQQVSTESAQLRSDDKHHVADAHPTNGFTHKSVDPSTPVASPSFDPFTQATKFFAHLVHPVNGVSHTATDGNTTHAYGLTHELGHVMSVLNGLHQVLAHPSLGSLLSASNGSHTVHADPSAGVSIASTIAHLIQAPNASLDNSGNLSHTGNHSAGGNVSAEGEISGSAGSFSTGLTVAGQSITGGLGASTQTSSLIRAASDAAAAAAGVAVAGLYINTSVSAGVGLVAVRLV